MIARKLLDELQQLNREEKLEVIKFLNDELSEDIDKYVDGRRIFKMSPRFTWSDGGAAMIRVLEEDQARHD